MKVLLAVDGSGDTKKMLAYLAAHEDLLGANPTFIVLNVQPAVPGHAARVVGKDAVAEYQRTEADKVLGPVCKFLTQQSVTYTSSHRSGHAADEILRAAKKSKVDVIVMGSAGRRGISSLLLGSVTQSVLSGSEVPVMVIR